MTTKLGDQRRGLRQATWLMQFLAAEVKNQRGNHSMNKGLIVMLLMWLAVSSPSSSIAADLSELNDKIQELEEKVRAKEDWARSSLSDRLTSRAELYAKEGKLELAEADFNRAMQIAPENGLPFEVRAHFYEKQGKIQLAEADFNRAVQLYPGFLTARAFHYKRQGKNQLAEADFSRAVQLAPADYNNLHYRAEFYETQGKFELAEADYNRMVQLNPKSCLHDRAEFYEKQGKFGLAEADYNRMVQLDPESCLDDRAEFYEKQGKFELAEADLNTLIQLKPDKYNFWRRGRVHERQGKWQLAEADYSCAIKLDGDFLCYRAELYEKQGKLDLAEADWSRAVQLKPQESLPSRALLHEEQGKLQLAEADWNFAVQLNPADSLGPRAEFHERHKKLQAAEADYNLAVQLEPKHNLPLRAMFYERQGNAQQAEADLNRAVGADPRNNLIERAKLFERQGKLNEALRDIEAFIATGETDKRSKAKFIRINILAEMGKKDLADTGARELFILDRPGEDFPSSLYRRSQVNLFLGKPQEALSELLDAKHKDNLSWPLTEMTLGAAYERLGDQSSACKAYARTLELAGKSPHRLDADYAMSAEQARRRLVVLGTKSITTPITWARRTKSVPLALIGLQGSTSNLAGIHAGAAVKPASTTQITSASVPESVTENHSSRRSGDRPVADKWALVIGISKFKNDKYNLKFAAKDAVDFYKFLTETANFKKDHVLLMVNDKATRENIITAFGDKFLPAVALPDDMVVVFVSTHGTPKNRDQGGRNYIVAYDTDVSKLYATGVDMDELYRRVKEAVKTDRVLIVMDTCYSGAGVPGAKSVSDVANFDANEIAQGCGHLVITSSSPNERSWESRVSPNGIFTKYLIQSLRSNNAKTDVKSAFAQVQEQVTWEVKSAFNTNQTPQLGGEWEGRELILSVPATKPRQMFNPELLQMMRAWSASAGTNASALQGTSQVKPTPALLSRPSRIDGTHIHKPTH